LGFTGSFKEKGQDAPWQDEGPCLCKFNSKLKQKKKATEQEIPLWGKLVVDILEDGENEWITGVAPIVDKPQDHEDEGVGAQKKKKMKVYKNKEQQQDRPKGRELPALELERGQEGSLILLMAMEMSLNLRHLLMQKMMTWVSSPKVWKQSLIWLLDVWWWMDLCYPCINLELVNYSTNLN